MNKFTIRKYCFRNWTKMMINPSAVFMWICSKNSSWIAPLDHLGYGHWAHFPCVLVLKCNLASASHFNGIFFQRTSKIVRQISIGIEMRLSIMFFFKYHQQPASVQNFILTWNKNRCLARPTTILLLFQFYSATFLLFQINETNKSATISKILYWKLNIKSTTKNFTAILVSKIQ